MTVNNIQDRITLTANGSTTEWVFPFPVVGDEFVEVFITSAAGSTVQLAPSLYTVILDPLIGANPTSQSGKVIFPLTGAPLAVGFSLTIFRNLPAIQSASISNQSIVYPPIIEQEFDYLTLLIGGSVSNLDRAFKVGPTDPLPHDVPPVAQRAGFAAFFDPIGDLVPGAIPGGGDVFISAAMKPVVEAGTLELARDLMGISTIPTEVSNTYVVTAADDRHVLNLEGLFYSVVIGNPAGFRPQFQAFIYNRSDRGKLIQAFGFPDFILWPRQFTWIFNTTPGWIVTNPGRWRALLPQQFYVDNALGNDSSDGLAPGNQAFKMIQKAVSVVESLVDGDFTINLSNGTHLVGAGVICDKDVPGANGYNIVGNPTTPNNVIINCNLPGTCFLVKDNSHVTLKGVRLTSPNGNGVNAQGGGAITLDGVNFGPMPAAGTANYHMNAAVNGVINVISPYHIGGGAAVHLSASTGGSIFYEPQTITFDTTSIFTSGFIVTEGGTAILSRFNNTFVNPSACGGKQYTVGLNAAVWLRPIPDYPGDAPGTTFNGGQVL